MPTGYVFATEAGTNFSGPATTSTGLCGVGTATEQSMAAPTLGPSRPLAWIVSKLTDPVEPGLGKFKIRDIVSCFRHPHNRASYKLRNFKVLVGGLGRF